VSNAETLLDVPVPSVDGTVPLQASALRMLRQPRREPDREFLGS